MTYQEMLNQQNASLEERKTPSKKIEPIIRQAKRLARWLLFRKFMDWLTDNERFARDLRELLQILSAKPPKDIETTSQQHQNSDMDIFGLGEFAGL